MSPPQDYVPIDEFPDLDGSGGSGPLQLQEDGDVLTWDLTFRSDFDIQSIANTTPIQVTTATPHTFKNGDVVTIVGAAVSAAIGSFTVTRISSTVFSLGSTTASGTGGASGRAFKAKLGLFTRLMDAAWYLGKRLLGSTYTTGLVSIQGRKTLRRPRVVLTDADHTIDTSQGDCFELNGAPAASRVIKLRTTSAPQPEIGEIIEIIAPGLDSGALGSNIYQVQRENGTLIASFYGRNVAPLENVAAQFEFTGTKWRLGMNSGYDSSGSGFGVLAGTDA